MTEAGTALSVLIPTHGRPVLLRRTLESLAACRLPEGYRETVVVENGSRDGAEAVVEEIGAAHPDLRLRYLHVEWGNKSHALNAALETVGDGLVVFFDDDIRLEPGVLEAYAEAARDHDGGVYFGGPFGVDYEERPPEWLLPLLPLSAQGVCFEQGDRPAVGRYLGLNWAAFVRDLQALGGFSPAYGPGSPTGATGQEYDMQRRLHAAGVAPKDVTGAWVWHYVPRQRCSPEWTLHRKYRAGLEDGLQTRRSGNRVRLLRTSKHAVRSLLSLVKRTLLRDPEGRFASRVSLWRDAGFISGYVFRR